MYYRIIIVLTVILAVTGGVLADEFSPLSVDYMQFNYRGATIMPEPPSPVTKTGLIAHDNYNFIVNCYLDSILVDIAFAIDSTGSMADDIDGVRSTIEAFTHFLDSLGFRYRFGACPFGDSTEGMWDFDPTTPHPTYEMTDDFLEFKTKLDGCGAYGGWDIPEEYLDALAALMRHYDWRFNATKIIIGFADAPFCESVDMACSTCNSNEIKEDILDELLADGFILFNVTPKYFQFDVTSCVPPHPYHVNWYKGSSTRTGGKWYELRAVSWDTIFAEIGDYIRDHQTIRVTIVNEGTNTIYRVNGEFIGDPCFNFAPIHADPGTIFALAPGDTALFTWRFELFDTLECPMDSSSKYCFSVAFHSVNGIDVPNPDLVTGGCIWFGEDCRCDGPYASRLFPPEDVTTSCADQCIEYSMLSECGIDTSSFVFKVRRNPSDDWMDYHWDDATLAMDDDTGFGWCPLGASQFEHGDTVEYELYALDDIVGVPLHHSPVAGDFIVDLMPPVYDSLYPADLAVIKDVPDYVSIGITDDIAGVDTSTGLWMTVNDSMFLLDDPNLTYEESTLRLDVTESLLDLFPIQDTTEVCVGAQDIPDLCEPNTSSVCWKFVIDFLELYLPELLVAPGADFTVPVIAINPQRFSIEEFDISIRYSPDIITFTGATKIGSALGASWTVNIDASVDGIIRVYGDGTSFTPNNDTLVMLEASVHTDAPSASFTPLTYDEPDGIALNKGNVGYNVIENGWVLIDWAPEYWSHDLTFDSDEQPYNTVLTFGMSAAASRFYDPGLDVIYVPQPKNRANAYFPINDSNYTYIERLSRDARSMYAELPVTWYIVTVGEPGLLTWSAFGLPEGILMLNDMYEMHHHDSYRYAANETLKIVYDRPSPGISEIELSPGWNLIGFPYIPTVPAIPNILSDAFYELFGYDDYQRNYFGTNTAEKGHGYWVFNNTGATYPIGGIEVPGYVYPLVRGWNLVGSSYIPSADYSSGPTVLQPQTWDPTMSKYVTSSFIEAGKGYWVLSMGEGDFRVPAGYVPPGKQISEPSWTAVLTFGNKSYTIGSGDLRNSRGIPPSGPDDELNIPGALLYDKFKMWDLILPNGDCWIFEAKENGVLTWDIAATPPLEMSIKGKTFPMEENGSVILARGDIATITLGKPLPTDYAVSIKPNPANAAFTITVELPCKSDVKVTLYNILGHRIDRIADGEMSAGTHRFNWRAADQPSGIYLVRVDWGKGSDVARVVLLK